ncbi:Monocarboxylate transporter 8 [Anthophora plagiata]
MKTRDSNERDISPAYEDSGVATSGELGEHSFSGECEGIDCLQKPEVPQGFEEDENRDPRYIARCTIRQHYYPESGWGWVVVVTSVMVQILATGIHGAVGTWLLLEGTKRYRQPVFNVGWLGAMSTGVALLVSPVTIAFCRRKSTRLTAVLGGLVTALGCLFTSFASQFHQLFFSYGTVVGIGVGMTRDCSTLMVAQYFKRRRELVEIFIVSGSGLGIAVMSAFIKGMISKIGWRLGLQAVTGVVFLTFILGTFYRSASLYHPQRRAILHLKNQKRKIKDKNKTDDRPPFFDFSTLKSKTVRILLVSTGISAFGINTPIFYLAHQAEEEGLGDTVVLLQAYLGLAWTLGCVAFGLLVVHRSVECRIARQYLTQAAVFVCGLCILALTAVQGNYHGYVLFAWIYGIFCGGYHYSLKMYTYERVRARNFARTWGFVQCSQAIPIAIGVPISGYMNVGCGGKAGYYFSSTCVLVGSFTLFFIDLHRRNLSRHKHIRSNGTKHLCVSDSCPQRRKLSFSQEPENDGGPHVTAAGAAAAALVLGTEIAPTPGEMIDALAPEKPELTCISEEGIADMDLPDNVLEDFDYIGDCITSCNKVENYLMLSEFENNLIAEIPIITDRRGRRWSLARSKGGQSNFDRPASLPSTNDEANSKPKWHVTNVPPNNRVITVIDEASA